VKATVKSEDEHVVEIGAGLGTLTDRLADVARNGQVTAVERDRDMVAVLRADLGQRPNVVIAEANALEFDYAAVATAAGKRVAVVGNLPYQIASRLIFGMLEARSAWSRAVIMLQKEMAERVVAEADSEHYSALSTMVQTYANVRTVTHAGSRCFYPAPRVDSTVIEMVPLAGDKTRAPIDDEKRYSALVHAAFGQRRKTLRNALRSRWDDEAIAEGFGKTGLDSGRRGETLTVAEFAVLANALPNARPT
jgi:16S rRNA (adenine1518-N6/adenine1519-N6)-dimethyltransferase